MSFAETGTCEVIGVPGWDAYGSEDKLPTVPHRKCFGHGCDNPDLKVGELARVCRGLWARGCCPPWPRTLELNIQVVATKC